jgi:hypothetical protein
VISALTRALATRYTFTSMPVSFPPPDADGNDLLFFLAPQVGNWTVVIQAHATRRGNPHLSDLAYILSAKLNTCTLTLNVHDDDILFYNLYRAGKELDGYNSAPQYFEQEPLSEEKILAQRHDPFSFTPLLPKGATCDQLQAILNKGWWAAHDAGRLGQNGLPPRGEPHFVFEHERMIALGDLLQLHGAPTGYPYAGWYRSSKINWTSLIALQGRPKAADSR